MSAHTSYPEQVQHTSAKLTAALDYARRDVPVFPCKPGGKTPLTKHGHHDAATDPEQIKAWWTRWPAANIGIPTGERSGLLVLDVDPRHGGDASLEALEAEHGQLPRSYTVRTGSGGRHLYFRYPTGSGIRNSKDKLGLGLDVRGEGGYVVAPPSVTTSAYKPLDKAPLATPPAYLPKLLRNDPRPSRKPPATPRPPVLSGETIPEGGRNAGLTRVAGRLRSRGFDGPELLAELERINADQCSPPLPAPEVAKIARSAERWPIGNVSPGPAPEVLEALERIARDLLNYRAWPGVGGKTERSIVAALVVLARQHGQLCPAGVRVEVSFRALALKAAVPVRTVTRAIFRLKAGRGEPGEGRGERGILRADNLDRRPGEAGALVLLHRESGQGVHTPTTGFAFGRATVVGGVDTLTTPRLRNSAPGILRLGKTAEAIVDHLDASRAGCVDVPDLAALMGSTHTRYLKRHVIPRLIEAGIATLTGDRLALTADWRGNLDRERERAGEIERYRLDVKQYERDRLNHTVKLLNWRGWSVDRISERVGIAPERVRQILKRPEPVPEPETRPAPVRSPKEAPANEGVSAHNTSEMVIEITPDPPEPTGPEPDTAPGVSLSALAVAVRGYLDANPKDRRQPPGWIGLTLWAYGRVDGKPTPAEIRDALEELHERMAA